MDASVVQHLLECAVVSSALFVECCVRYCNSSLRRQHSHKVQSIFSERAAPDMVLQVTDTSHGVTNHGRQTQDRERSILDNERVIEESRIRGGIRNDHTFCLCVQHIVQHGDWQLVLQLKLSSWDGGRWRQRWGASGWRGEKSPVSRRFGQRGTFSSDDTRIFRVMGAGLDDPLHRTYFRQN